MSLLEVYTSAADAAAAGEGRGCSAALAYDGHGRVFAVGPDGLLRAADVRSRLLAGSKLRARDPGASDPPKGALPLRTLEPTPPLAFRPDKMSFSRGGQFAVVSGPRDDGSEVHGVAVVDVTDTLLNKGTGRETVRSFTLGGGLFGSRPGLRPLQVSWHPDSNQHVAVLTSDNTLLLFNAAHPRHPEQTFELACFQASRPQDFGARQRDCAVSFSFGAPAYSWERFCIYFLSLAGEIYALCPVVPFGTRCPNHLVRRLALVTSQMEGPAAQTTEAWLQKAFPGALHGDGLGQGRWTTAPHALESFSPALQGPLQCTSTGNASPSGMDLWPAASMALLHWEGFSTGLDPSGEAPSPTRGCSAIVAAGAGKVQAAIVVGDVAPAWAESPPRVWHNDDGELAAARHRSLICQRSSLQPKLLLVDEIPITALVDGDISDPDSEDEGTSQIQQLTVLQDPVQPESVYVLHACGLVGISLSWLPLLGDYLVQSSLEGHNSTGLGVPQLPPPVVLDLGGDWALDGLVGGCVLGDAISGTAVLLVSSSGAGQVVSTYEMKYPTEDAGAAQSAVSPAPQSPNALPNSFGSPMAVHSAEVMAGNTAQVVVAEAEAALQEQYSWLVKGPDTLLTISKAPGLSCSDIEGQKQMHAAIAQLHKKHVEFITQGHQFITHKVPLLRKESSRQAEKETRLRQLQDSADVKARLLEDRMQRATRFNQNLTRRLELLSMLDSSMPRPLSEKEKAFGSEELPMREAEVASLRKRMQGLTARAAQAVSASGQEAADSAGAAVRAQLMPAMQLQRLQEELVRVNGRISQNQEKLTQAEAYLLELKLKAK